MIQAMDYSFKSLRTIKKIKVNPKIICVRVFTNEGDATEWFIFDAKDPKYDRIYSKQKKDGGKSRGRGAYCGSCLHGDQYCHHGSSDDQVKLMPEVSCQVTRFASWAVLPDSHLYCVGCYERPSSPSIDKGRELHIDDDAGKAKNKVFFFNLNATSPGGLPCSEALPDTLTCRKAPHTLVLGGLLYVVGGVYHADDDNDNYDGDEASIAIDDGVVDEDERQTLEASHEVSKLHLSIDLEEARADDDDEQQKAILASGPLSSFSSSHEHCVDDDNEPQIRGKVPGVGPMEVTDSLPWDASAMSAIGDDGLLQESWMQESWMIIKENRIHLDENYMNGEGVVTKARPWAEVFNLQRQTWEGLPEPPNTLSEGYGSGFICAVLEVDKVILVGSAKDNVLYSYSPNTGNSWSILRGHDLDPSCSGQAVVVDRTLYWFTTLGYLKAYDLNKKMWYQGIVDGSWDGEILGTYRFTPGLVHVESNLFCLIWADTEISVGATAQSQQSHLHCLKFEVDTLKVMDPLCKGSLAISIKSCHTRRIDHGINLVDCQVL